MKKLIIIEYLTTSPQKISSLKSGLFKEGLKMVNSFSLNLNKRSANSNIIVFRHKNLSVIKNDGLSFLRTSDKVFFLDLLSNFCPKKTQIILIAPESNGISSSIFKSIQNKGFSVLSSNYSLIKIFCSKTKTIKFLKNKKIPCVDLIKNLENIDKEKKIIIKPDQGAGSQNTFIFDRFFCTKDFLEKIDFDFVVQYYQKGLLGSLNVIFYKNQNFLLSCNKHILKSNNIKIKQIGSVIGGLEEYRSDFQNLINLINSKIKGLYGFINLDLVKVDGMWKIIEVNPRISSTYCGLKKAYGQEITNLISDFYLGKRELDQKKIPLKKPIEIFF